MVATHAGPVQITQGLIYSKYLTEYGKRYYGVLVAFDEAVQQGDVQLAEALWRCVSLQC